MAKNCFSGVCMDRVALEFPVYEMQTIERDIQSMCKYEVAVDMSKYYFDKQCLLDIGISSVANPPEKEKKQRNTFKICNVRIMCDRMRGHIGYHILSKKELDRQCGVGSAVCRVALTSLNKTVLSF